MKKLIVSLLIIIPVIFYLKLKNSASESNGRKRILEKEPVKAKAAGLKKTSGRKEIKVPASKTAANKNTRCKAVTGSGKKCTRESLPDSEFCWQHNSQ